MPYLNPILGLVLLLFGRSLYWAFVAIGGFLVGARLAGELFGGSTDTTQLLVALAAGVVGALLAMLAQRIAFAAGGFFAGAYLALAAARAVQASGPELLWAVIGGLVGAFIAAALMDWAIIVLSSLAGAWAIVESMGLDPAIGAWLFVVIAALGVMFQARRLDPGAGES